MCLDLKQDADKAVLAEMIDAADVFVQNLAPGAIEKLGFAPQTLRARNPRLVTCSISGYGSEGPYRDLKAYDLLVQAESGLSGITGNEHGMARVGVSVCDIAAGMTAFQAVLQALIGRAKTGEGRHIDVSLFHALADWMNVPYLQYVYGGKEPARSGLNHPTIAPYGAYACRDGASVLFSIQNEREWANLCRDVLLAPDVATDPLFSDNSKRVAHREKLDAIVTGAFAMADRAEMIERLETARIAYGRVSSMQDLADHPQNRFVSVETPSGPVSYLAPAPASTERTRRSGPCRRSASTPRPCARSSPRRPVWRTRPDAGRGLAARPPSPYAADDLGGSNDMTGRLDGKSALVTGAASGFGAAIARSFAKEGARVVIMDLDEAGGARVAEEIGAAATSLKGDVTRREDFDRAVARTVEHGGRLDILVNNAGWTHRNKPLEEVSEEEFDRVYAINVKSIYHSVQASLPTFTGQGAGVIINIGSTAGLRPGRASPGTTAPRAR